MMFEDDFENLLSGYPDAVQDRSLFSGLVKDYFPEQQMKINLLLNAYQLGIAADLAAAKDVNQAFAYRYVKKMIDDYGVSRVHADWAVSEWCVIYGQRILHKPCEIKLSSGKNAGPAIRTEQEQPTKYGDLFSYERSVDRSGLAATGFHGEDQRMIIFQNAAKGTPVVEIKEGAFSESDVEEVILTEGYRRIGARAFQGCGGLHQIVLPSSLRELGDFSMAGCVGLKSLTLPEALSEIGAFALSGTGIRGITIPESVLFLGEGVFSGCGNLERLDIPQNIGDIPKGMCRNCGSLMRVELHDCLRSIGDEAFSGCGLLTTIFIPDSVQSIGDHAFDGVDRKFILQCSYGSYAESYARRMKLRYQLV